MKKITPLFLLTVFTVLLFSCKKEDHIDPDNAGKIPGSWDLVNMTVLAEVTGTVNTTEGIEKTVTTCDYTTTENEGGFLIDSNTLSCGPMMFSLNTVTRTSRYINGILKVSREDPYRLKAAYTGGGSRYRLAGRDSIYFEHSPFNLPDGSNIAVRPDETSRGRISWSKDTLILRLNSYNIITDDLTGESLVSKSTQAIKLKKH